LDRVETRDKKHEHRAGICDNCGATLAFEGLLSSYTYPKPNGDERMVIIFWVLVGVIIGAFVGWNVAQPPWAKDIQDRVVGIIESLTKKKDTK
jgi:hypothetical protein